MRRAVMAAMLLATSMGGLANASGVSPHDAMVAMSDGVSLDASLYLPDPLPSQPVPLIVRQHGGGSSKDSEYDVLYGRKYVETGKFALLMYSHRGHGNSGGVFDFFGARTTIDFSEMLDWVQDNYGSAVNVGNVGAVGISQGGGESLLPAEADSRVKVVAVGNTFDDLNRALNPEDCFKASLAVGIFGLAYKRVAARTDDATAIRWGTQWFTDTEDQPVGPIPSTASEAFDHSPLAHVEPGAAPYTNGLNVPVFWMQSWEDELFPADMPDEILTRLESKKIPTHRWYSSGGHLASPDFMPDQVAKEAAILDWMDEFLNGVDHGFASGVRPKVDYAHRLTAGEPGTWDHHTASAWPLPNATDVTYHALANGALATSSGSQYIAPIATITNDVVSVNAAHDPLMREIQRQARQSGYVERTPQNISPVDAATFTTGPLAPLTFTGTAKLHLAMTTDAKRVAQINVKMFDVAPDGSRTFVTRGCRSWEDLTGSFDVELWPNSHTFASGHRLELVISAVDNPTFKSDTEPQTTRLFVGTDLTLPTT